MKKPNAWLITFSDLITLLITFFTLIISMSSMDNKALKKSFTFFSGGPGIMNYGNKVSNKLVDIKDEIKSLKLSDKDINAIIEIIKKFSLLPKQALKIFLLKKELNEFKYHLKVINNTDVKIILNSNTLYYPVSYNLNNYGKKFALKISNIILQTNGSIIIKMFTQKFPVQTANIENNVDLSCKRLAKLIDFLQKKNISYNRIFVMGWGDKVKKLNTDIIEITFKDFLKIEKQEVKNG